MAKAPESASSEPFVSKQDRPELNADTPLSELRVRDLQTILGSSPRKAHDKRFEKFLIFDIQQQKFSPWKENYDKQVEKFSPWKENYDTMLQLEKDIKDARDTTAPPTSPEGDPLGQIAQSLTGLQNTVNQLENEVAQLKAKAKG
jgi:hypothetical protein